MLVAGSTVSHQQEGKMMHTINCEQQMVFDPAQDANDLPCCTLETHSTCERPVLAC